MSKYATRPDFFANFPILSRQKELDKKGVTDEERSIYGMTQTGGWMLFSEYKDQLLTELDQLTETAIATGVSKEQIGENAIVTSLVKGLLKKLWNKCADAKEACERPDGANK
jgi:hypothetical protein